MDDDVDGPDSREYCTLLNCRQDLELALHPEDTKLVSFLHIQGWITDEVRNSIFDPHSTLTEKQKVCTLLYEIEKKVRLNPRNYCILTGYLKEDQKMYKDILTILDNEYCARSKTKKYIQYI